MGLNEPAGNTRQDAQEESDRESDEGVTSLPSMTMTGDGRRRWAAEELPGPQLLGGSRGPGTPTSGRPHLVSCPWAITPFASIRV
jgi:hypothetical protein